MKKLMCAIAAITAGSVMAVESAIESANVVGYANAPTVVGSKAGGVSFCAVGGGTLGTLNDIRVGGYDGLGEEGMFMGEVYAAKLDEFGRTIMKDGVSVTWMWADWEEEGEGGEMIRYTGWSNDDGELIGDQIPVALGEGLWIQSDSTDWKILTSGQVYDQVVPCELVVGSRFCVNPCPASINLGMCVVGGYDDLGEEGMFMGEVYAAKLDEFGRTIMKDGVSVTWMWADWEEEGESGEMVRYTGWANDDGELIGDQIPLALGEGLWVQSDSTDWTFVFPTVLGE